jgi:serine/threonine protein kinase
MMIVRFDMSLTKSLTLSRVPGLDDYVIEKEINHGYFGRVYQAKELSSEKRWACKFMQKALLNDRQKRNIQREVFNNNNEIFRFLSSQKTFSLPWQAEGLLVSYFLKLPSKRKSLYGLSYHD